MEERVTCILSKRLPRRGVSLTRSHRAGILGSLFVILRIVATPEPAHALKIKAVYDDNGVYLGCTVVYSDGTGSTSSPSKIDEASCLRGARDFPSANVHVSVYQFGDFNGLGRRALSSFTALPVRTPDGSLGIPVFDATVLDSGTQTGLGAALRLKDWLALDLGLTVGAGTASRTSTLPAAREEADFRLFGGSITAKVYPLQNAVARVDPWLSAGVRGLALRPTGGTYTTYPDGPQRLDVPGRRFEPESTVDLVSGAGIDVRLTDRFGVTFSGQHGFGTGWLAGVGLTFALSSRTTEIFPAPPSTTGELGPAAFYWIDPNDPAGETTCTGKGGMVSAQNGRRLCAGQPGETMISFAITDGRPYSAQSCLDKRGAISTNDIGRSVCNLRTTPRTEWGWSCETCNSLCSGPCFLNADLNCICFPFKF